MHMKIPKEFRWKPTGRTLGEGGQAQVQEVEDSSGEYGGKYALKVLAKGKLIQAMEARYPDEKFSFKKRCTRNFSKKYLRKIEDLKKWLIKRI